MDNLSLFNFCTKLLTEPIGFLDTYFKGNKVATAHKKKLNKILYQFVFFKCLVDFFLKAIYVLFFSVNLQEKREALIIFPFAFLFQLAVLFIWVYLILPIIYRFLCWSFQEIIYWTGGTITAEKGIEIRLYIIAYALLLRFIRYPIELIVRLLCWWKFDLLFVIPNIGLWIVVVVKVLYVNYTIIKKMTNARPLLAVFLDVVIFVITNIIVIISVRGFYKFCAMYMYL